MKFGISLRMIITVVLYGFIFSLFLLGCNNNSSIDTPKDIIEETPTDENTIEDEPEWVDPWDGLPPEEIERLEEQDKLIGRHGAAFYGFYPEDTVGLSLSEMYPLTIGDIINGFIATPPSGYDDGPGTAPSGGGSAVEIGKIEGIYLSSNSTQGWMWYAVKEGPSLPKIYNVDTEDTKLNEHGQTVEITYTYNSTDEVMDYSIYSVWFTYTYKPSYQIRYSVYAWKKTGEGMKRFCLVFD